MFMISLFQWPHKTTRFFAWEGAKNHPLKYSNIKTNSSQAVITNTIESTFLCEFFVFSLRCVLELFDSAGSTGVITIAFVIDAPVQTATIAWLWYHRGVGVIFRCVDWHHHHYLRQWKAPRSDRDNHLAVISSRRRCHRGKILVPCLVSPHCCRSTCNLFARLHPSCPDTSISPRTHRSFVKTISHSQQQPSSARRSSFILITTWQHHNYEWVFLKWLTI